MSMDSNKKLLKAGFTILRRSDYPVVCIKKCQYHEPKKGMISGMIVWVCYQRCFKSKTERDRRMKECLEDDLTVED